MEEDLHRKRKINRIYVRAEATFVCQIKWYGFLKQNAKINSLPGTGRHWFQVYKWLCTEATSNNGLHRIRMGHLIPRFWQAAFSISLLLLVCRLSVLKLWNISWYENISSESWEENVLIFFAEFECFFRRFFGVFVVVEHFASVLHNFSISHWHRVREMNYRSCCCATTTAVLLSLSQCSVLSSHLHLRRIPANKHHCKTIFGCDFYPLF